MDDPSLLPFLNNNGNGHHYSHGTMSMDSEIEHEEDELDEDDVLDDDDDDDDVDETERNPVYPEDEIEEDEIDEDEIDDEANQDEQEIVLPPPPPPPPLSSVTEQLIQSERGGRRKGVPRRLQISPQTANAAAPQQRLLPPVSTTKNCSSNDQPILTSDQEENEDLHNHHATSLSLDFFSQHLNGNYIENFDENNNNNHYYEEENTLEIVDDILADLVTNIVRDIRQQRQTNGKQQPIIPHKINGHSHSKPTTNGISKSIIQKHEQKLSNGKSTLPNLVSTNSIKSSKSQCQQSLNSSPGKLSDSSTLFNELTKMMHLNSQQQLVKHKHSLSPSSPSSSSSSTTKRQKISETSSPSAIQQHHQQLLWQMTQQFLMSPQATDIDSSSLLKQQLLGLTPPGAQPKRPGRPPKQPAHPQVMRSSTNMVPPTSHSSASTSSFERASFAPRRRGRPPKYVTERAGLTALPPSHDLDQSSFDQLFAAIENNNVNGNSGRPSSAAFQSALASMLGHQAGLAIPPPPSIAPPPLPSAIRNGTPASMMKQSAGQTRHSLPSSSSSSKAAKISRGMIGGGHALELPLMATKKRGPGRPPKNQTLVDSHQVVQATKRMNSSLSNNNNNNNNNFPPTMVPSSHSSFDLNAAFVEMLQQQQQLQHPR